MTEGKSVCAECGTEILASTAARFGGTCARCAKLSAEERRERRDFERRLRSGAIFTPGPEELRSARTQDDLLRPRRRWIVENAEAAFGGTRDLDAALARATESSSAHLFLVSDAGERLHAAYNTAFAVLEYHLQDGSGHRYAHTVQNARAQVNRELQLDRCCPCCDVGLSWYPSRFHMPRSIAFAILAELALDAPASRTGCSWLEYADDLSRIDPGCG